MKEWERWKPGVRKALVLFVAFAIVLVILIVLEAIYNNVTWFNVRRSMLFFFQLWLVVAVPITVSLRLLQESWRLAAAFVAAVALLAFYAPYAHCSNAMIACGSFDTLSLAAYWAGAAILVLAVAGLTLLEYRRIR